MTGPPAPFQWCLYFAPRLTRIQRVTFNETNVLSTYNERHGNMEVGSVLVLR